MNEFFVEKNTLKGEEFLRENYEDKSEESIEVRVILNENIKYVDHDGIRYININYKLKEATA